MIAKAGLIKGAIAIIGAAVILLAIFAIVPSDPDASNTVEVPEHAQAEEILLEDGTPVGHVYIWSNNLETLFIKYVMDEGWEMQSSSLSVGTQLSDIFQRNGNPIPDKFPLSEDFDPASSNHLYRMDIDGLYTKEDILYIAAHCRAENTTDEAQKGVEKTGWAGDNHFKGSSHATFIIFKFSKEEIWPPSGTASFGFEDLRLKEKGTEGNNSNDWDYNDMVFDVSIRTSYLENKLVWMEWSFKAEEKIANFNHSVHFLISAGTFMSDGICDVTYTKNGGDEVIGTEKMDFKEDSDFDVGVFVNGNTNDAVLDEHVTTIRITFEKGYHFDLSHFGYNELDAHATGLFFEPYLLVKGTNEEIHMGDLRVVFVPEDWEWPSPDGTPIWERYPYDFKTGNGVFHDERADEPIFVGKWYMV